MKVEVTLNGRSHTVAVEPLASQPGQVAATIDGRRRVFDVSWSDAGTLSMIEDGVAYEVRLHPRGNGAVGVQIGGTLYETVVDSRGGQRSAGRAAAGNTPDGLGAAVVIKAPMPGRVVRVLVSVGDRVSARQGIVVVEAMKMENELRAPREGTVKEIAVAPGAAVEAGAMLAVLGE